MKRKVNTNEQLANNDNLTDKILDLCLYQQIEESFHWMKLIEKQIEFCEMQIAHLEEYKPFWFQKKKLKAYYEDIDLLEDKICDYYRQINNEVKIIEKMRNSISKENQ